MGATHNSYVHTHPLSKNFQMSQIFPCIPVLQSVEVLLLSLPALLGSHLWERGSHRSTLMPFGYKKLQYMYMYMYT